MVECGTSGSSERIKKTASTFLLAVDSDANNLFYTSMLLQRFEYHICTAKTAEEALEMATVAVPSLVITELALSGMSGLEMIRKLRNEQRTAEVPVILTTTKLAAEQERQCRLAGASAFLWKPVQAEELFRTVQAVIEPKPRSNIRIHTRLPVLVNNAPLDCAEGECASVLSAHGMYIRTFKPFPKDTRLPIQIIINDNAIFVEAMVLYSHKFGEGPFGEPGMGLRFVSITPRDQELIQQFIREEVNRGIEPV